MPRKFKNKKVNMNQKIQQVINSNLERKHAGNTLNAVSYSTTGTGYDVVDFAQGIDTNERIGREVRVTSFRMQGVWHFADTTNVIRMILYIPKDPSVGISPASVYSLLDHDSFTILLDKYIAVGSGGPAVKVMNYVRSFTRKGKSKGMKVRYNGTASTSTTLNRMKLYIVSDSGAAVHPTFTGTYNTYFTDA